MLLQMVQFEKCALGIVVIEEGFVHLTPGLGQADNLKEILRFWHRPASLATSKSC